MERSENLFHFLSNGERYKVDKRGTLMHSSFTQEEKEAFYDILQKFKKDDTETFLKKIRCVCIRRLYRDEFPVVQEMKDEINSMINTFNKTLDHLATLRSAKITGETNFYLAYMGSMELPAEYIEAARGMYDAVNKAGEMYNPLKELIEIIEEQSNTWKKPSGRPSADSTEFAFHIANCFYECFKVMPTTYRDGPFFNVIQTALGALDLPNKDPSKMVREAVTRLKDTNK